MKTATTGGAASPLSAAGAPGTTRLPDVQGKRITVLLADDHRVVREGFRALLEAEGDIEVVGEAQTGRQAVELTRGLLPDVVVMDTAVPLLNGLGATRQLGKAVPSARVLILSAHGQLSSRELEVLQSIAEGQASKQIAAQLTITLIVVEAPPNERRPVTPQRH